MKNSAKKIDEKYKDIVFNAEIIPTAKPICFEYNNSSCKDLRLYWHKQLKK